MNLTQSIYNITHNECENQKGECGYDLCEQNRIDFIGVISEPHEQTEPAY